MQRQVRIGMLVTGFLLAGLAVAAPTEACSCVRPVNGCAGLAAADAVFLATVSRTEVRASPAPQTDRAGADTRNRVDVVGTAPLDTMVVTLTDVTPVRGLSAGVVLTASQKAACGYPFVHGERYLIVANREADGRLWVSSCGLTTKAAGAGPLVQYATALDSAPPSFSFLWGTVTLPDASAAASMTPAPGITIEVEGPVRRSVRSDAAGHYVFRDLPPGRYSVAAQWPAPFKPVQPPGGTRFTISASELPACLVVPLTGG